jgi:enoyl-CoA hydratase
MSTSVTRHGDVARIRMAHGKANAFDVEFLASLRASLREALASDARAVVLCAEGSIFSAGVDLPRVAGSSTRELAAFLAELSDALAELFLAPRPVVAAVNGHAIAGGAILALACDHRLMARGAGRIGVPELAVGVPFPLVPAEIVRYALGDMRAHRAMLGAALCPAERAVEEAWVDELVEPDQLAPRAHAVALELAAAPADSFARTKAILRAPVAERWAAGRAGHDAGTLAAWDSPAVRDAIRAYAARTLRK